MTEAFMVFGSILLGAGIILGLIVWLNGLNACDPFDLDGSCE